MGPYHIIVNPNAGAIRNGRLRAEDAAKMVGDGGCVTVTRDLQHLEALVAQLKQSGVRTVAVLGGDGTLLRTFTGFSDGSDDAELPAFFPLGGGTSNALMVELGLPSKPAKRLERLRAVLNGDPPRFEERKTLRVNGRVGLIFGAGYLRNASEFYDSHHVDGLWTSVVVTAKVVKGLVLKDPEIVRFLDPLASAIHYDDDRISLDAFNVAYLSSISKNPLKLNITPAASAAVDQFEAVMANLTVPEFLSTFFRMSFGAPMNAPRQERRLVRSVRIEAPHPVPWFMDGENFEPETSITVELGPTLRCVV